MKDQCSCGHERTQHYGNVGLCIVGPCTCLSFVSLTDTQKIVIRPGDLEYRGDCKDRRCQHPYLRHDEEMLVCCEEECSCCMYRE
jgi:hypothetical protein